MTRPNQQSIGTSTLRRGIRNLNPRMWLLCALLKFGFYNDLKELITPKVKEKSGLLCDP